MNKLVIGMRVLVRSNENEPVMEGVVTGFDKLGQWSKYAIPIVQDNNGRDWWALGAVLADTEENRAELNGLNPAQQWDKFKLRGLRFDPLDTE